MPSRGRRGGWSIRRRPPFRQPKQRILIVCEGEVTERRYFHALKLEARNPRVDVQIARQTGVPLVVVQEAIRLKAEAVSAARRERDDNERYDQVWGVFDVDEHPNLDQAVRLTQDKEIQLAISNPCFELWALLHFQDQRAHIERGHLRTALQRHLPGYDKELDFSKVHPTHEQAAQRAAELDRLAEEEDEDGRNPTTGVYKLTQVILADQ